MHLGGLGPQTKWELENVQLSFWEGGGSSADDQIVLLLVGQLQHRAFLRDCSHKSPKVVGAFCVKELCCLISKWSIIGNNWREKCVKHWTGAKEYKQKWHDLQKNGSVTPLSVEAGDDGLPLLLPKAGVQVQQVEQADEGQQALRLQPGRRHDDQTFHSEYKQNPFRMEAPQ